MEDIKNLPFEAAMAELDSIVKKMEAGEIKLAELVSFYERAAALKAHLEKTLSEAKMKIESVQAGGVVAGGQ